MKIDARIFFSDLCDSRLVDETLSLSSTRGELVLFRGGRSGSWMRVESLFLREDLVVIYRCNYESLTCQLRQKSCIFIILADAQSLKS